MLDVLYRDLLCARKAGPDVPVAQADELEATSPPDDNHFAERLAAVVTYDGSAEEPNEHLLNRDKGLPCGR